MRTADAYRAASAHKRRNEKAALDVLPLAGREVRLSRLLEFSGGDGDRAVHRHVRNLFSRQPREASQGDVEFAELVTQTGAIIIARHIDADVRRRAEEALRESEQNLRAVANVVPDLLWYSAPDG